MKIIVLIALLGVGSSLFAQYSPAAGEDGSTAIHKDSSVFIGWAADVVEFSPGPQDISIPGSPNVYFGDATEALNKAEGTSTDVVSLGDGGFITIRFHLPVMNGEGPDFAVFENGFDESFLELAHVEVSSDGENFVRFPSVSLTATDEQTGTFGTTNTELIHNLAGKFVQGYGTPFDLEDLVDSTGIDIDMINYVRIVDVVGSIDPTYGSYDSEGNLINDPFPTEFSSGGFDIDAVGLIHANGDYTASLDELGSTVNVYPNPSQQFIKISSTDEVKNIELFDLNGRQILSTKETEIDLSSLSITSGIYILKIQTAKGMVSEKITFNKL